MAKQYRTIVEAVQVADGLANQSEIESFLAYHYARFGDTWVAFHAAGGVEAMARVGDWLVKFPKFGFYVVSAPDFAKNFTPADK